MCFYLSQFHCPGCARQFKPTFQRCAADAWAGLSHTVPFLTLIDLIRSNSYCCPYIDCELNERIHHALFNLQVDAATEKKSFIQEGLTFLPYDVYINPEDDEPCEMALSDSEDDGDHLAVPRNAISHVPASRGNKGKRPMKSISFGSTVKVAKVQKGRSVYASKPLRDGPGSSRRTSRSSLRSPAERGTGRVSKRPSTPKAPRRRERNRDTVETLPNVPPQVPGAGLVMSLVKHCWQYLSSW